MKIAYILPCIILAWAGLNFVRTVLDKTILKKIKTGAIVKGSVYFLRFDLFCFAVNTAMIYFLHWTIFLTVIIAAIYLIITFLLFGFHS